MVGCRRMSVCGAPKLYGAELLSDLDVAWEWLKDEHQKKGRKIEKDRHRWRDMHWLFHRL